MYQHRTRQCNITELTKNNNNELAPNIGKSTKQRDKQRMTNDDAFGIEYYNEDILPADWFANVFDQKINLQSDVIKTALENDDRGQLLSIYTSNVENYGCFTDQKEFRACVRPVSGCWTSWNSWSDCSSSCGESGTRYRKRYCEGVDSAKNCVGDDEEIESCTGYNCDISENLGNQNTCIVCDDCNSLETNNKKFDPGPTTNQISRICPSDTRSTSFLEPESSPEPVGCQSTVTHQNGIKSVSKTCRSTFDCYADLADLLATGQCDLENEENSSCIYCCEGKDCNLNDQFESSFWVFLKLSFQKSPIVKLKRAFRKDNSTVDGVRRRFRKKFDRRWFKKMYDDFFGK